MEYIKIISSKDTFYIRQQVLRAGKPIESCQFDGDDLPTTTHFGLFIDEKLTGVVSVFKNINTIFNIENQYQIRGMAVLPEFQRNGLGKELVIHCEAYLKNLKATLIWFNARENAVLFYKKLGYNSVGAPFSIADIGIHYVMKKELATDYE